METRARRASSRCSKEHCAVWSYRWIMGPGKGSTAHPQSAHDHPATKRSKCARLRQMVGLDEHQRTRFKERWACSARIASTTNDDPQFVRCVHPRTDAAPWEPPCAPPPAVLRGRSTSTVRTRAQHPGPFVRPGRRPRSNAGTLFACTQGKDLFEANGAAPWHAARVVGSNAPRESAASALDSGVPVRRAGARNATSRARMEIDR